MRLAARALAVQPALLAARAALLAALPEAEAVLVRSDTRIDAEALAAAPRLRVVARAGVGLDNVDVRAATQAGVMVVNAPTANVVSAAELTVALLLAAARHVSPAHASLVRGESDRGRFTGTELRSEIEGHVLVETQFPTILRIATRGRWSVLLDH